MTAIHWLNAINGSFTNPANWSDGEIPDASDDAILDAVGSTFTVTSRSPEAVDGLQLAANATLSLTKAKFIAVDGVGSVVNAGIILIGAGAKMSEYGGNVFDNSGTIALDGEKGRRSALVFNYLDVTLIGGGQITMGGNGNNKITGNSDFSNIDFNIHNVNNTISGSGTLIGNRVVNIWNEAAGVIDADEAIPLIVNQYFINQGVIEATDHGELVVDTYILRGNENSSSGIILSENHSTLLLQGSALYNYGTLSVQSGSILEAYGAVKGAGSAIVGAGTLAFLSSFDEAVAFTGAGELELAKSQAFTNSITGFLRNGMTKLDLLDIGFVSAGEATFSGTKKSGVLTVTDGTHAAHIELIGNFLDSTFVTSSDGADGVIVVAQPTTAPATHAFVSAMAGLGGPVAEALQAGLPPPSHGVTLTEPRPHIA
jgi:hypothetical protein